MDFSGGSPPFGTRYLAGGSPPFGTRYLAGGSPPFGTSQVYVPPLPNPLQQQQQQQSAYQGQQDPVTMNFSGGSPSFGTRYINVHPLPSQRQQQQQQQHSAYQGQQDQWPSSGHGSYLQYQQRDFNQQQQQPDYRQQEYYTPQQMHQQQQRLQQQQQQQRLQQQQQQQRLQQQQQQQRLQQLQQQLALFEAGQYDTDDNYYPYPIGAAPYPAVSSGMPLGQGQGYGQGQSGGYFSGQAPNPVYSANGNENEVYHANNYTYNTNSGVPPATRYVSPPLSSQGSRNPQTLLPTQSQSFPSSASPTAPLATAQASYTLAKCRESRDYPVVVAIDFGMKFTKVAYAVSTDGKGISEINSWPGHSSLAVWTPSLITYNKRSNQMESWGYKARGDMKKSSAKDYCLLTNLKVHLDQRYDVPPLANGISVHQAISDYFRKLNEYIVPTIQKDFSTIKWLPDHFQYCLTVPGHWSDQAKQTMRSAVEAGLGLRTDPPIRLISISQEEATAIYCARRSDLDFRHGERFMIFLAPEGESVTLVMFEVNASASDGRVQQLKEVARSFDPSCGSDFVDANMERLLERRLRNYRGIISADEWEDLMSSFTGMIRGFDGQEDQFLNLPERLQALFAMEGEEAWFDDGYMILTAAELKKEVLEPVVIDALALIRTFLRQIGCRAVFLLGEFGSSEYVLRRMREEFEDQVEWISCPPRPELAISRGAVYAGLDSKVMR